MHFKRFKGFFENHEKLSEKIGFTQNVIARNNQKIEKIVKPEKIEKIEEVKKVNEIIQNED